MIKFYGLEAQWRKIVCDGSHCGGPRAEWLIARMDHISQVRRILRKLDWCNTGKYRGQMIFNSEYFDLCPACADWEAKRTNRHFFRKRGVK